MASTLSKTHLLAYFQEPTVIHENIEIYSPNYDSLPGTSSYFNAAYSSFIASLSFFRWLVIQELQLETKRLMAPQKKER